MRRKVEQDAVGIRKRCKSLAGFVKEAWPILEPSTPYVHNWHIDVICAALEAVTYGDMPPRLLINVPPGMMKSLLVSVFWPAWEWTMFPHLRYIATSYSERYTKRDSRRMRDLVNSDWYRLLWPHVRLVRIGESSFANGRMGTRDAMPFRSLTGGRGDRVLIDDPHSTETAESPTERETTLRIFKESVPTRVIDPKTSAIIIIMQRLHEMDISGYILSHADKMGYETIVLPMEFEDGREAESTVTWAEERTKYNELLFPQRFPRSVVERDKSIMGSYAVAGQFQQRPAPRGGGMFKRHWFEIIRALPSGELLRGVRWWDLAATAPNVINPDPDYTVGLLMFKLKTGIYIIADVVRLRGSDLDVERAIRNTAARDEDSWSVPVTTIIPEDPGAAGKFTANSLIRMLAGYRVRKGKEDNKHGKEQRAEPFAAQCEANNVKLLKAEWNDPFLDELTTFPASAHADQVDSGSGAFKELTIRIPGKQGAVKGLY
jgi:predicted phage terminase large subunit-like protein